MEDDVKIRQLFADFNPPMTSGDRFMERLRGSIDAVEEVRQQAAAIRRRSRIAVSVAAVTGFITGVLLTLLMPLLGDMVTSVDLSRPIFHVSRLSIDWHMLAWLASAAVSVVMAINAYDITMSRLAPAGERGSGGGGVD
ncbi:MAG: hypothetical protein NC342_03475 [Pseudoflavonifractor sp.]|nr:hypothetical protein [Alloprevotella sp.]MCM1116576.1 hypothetical protein [Pseudoflavonifractor sp.]